MLPELVIFGLGSNLGDREAYLQNAIASLIQNTELRLSDIKCSSVIETPALLPEGAPVEWDIPFLNIVMSAQTIATAEQILNVTKYTEAELGKHHRGHWAPREIDIDILALGTQIIASESLTIPHPHMEKRLFVMQPFAEILPDWVHPVIGKTASILLGEL